MLGGGGGGGGKKLVMVHFLCRLNFKISLYPQTYTQDAELLNLVENLVVFKGWFSRFAYAMNKNVDTSVNAYEPFNLNLVFLGIEKDVSHHD